MILTGIGTLLKCECQCQECCWFLKTIAPCKTVLVIMSSSIDDVCDVPFNCKNKMLLHRLIIILLPKITVAGFWPNLVVPNFLPFKELLHYPSIPIQSTGFSSRMKQFMENIGLLSAWEHHPVSYTHIHTDLVFNFYIGSFPSKWKAPFSYCGSLCSSS